MSPPRWFILLITIDGVSRMHTIEGTTDTSITDLAAIRGVRVIYVFKQPLTETEIRAAVSNGENVLFHDAFPDRFETAYPVAASTRGRPTFPPGPRWFIAAGIEGDITRLRGFSGTDRTDPARLDIEWASALYVFGLPVTEEELRAAVENLDNVDFEAVFADRIEAAYVVTPVGGARPSPRMLLPAVSE
jgi:hypothetical protein